MPVFKDGFEKEVKEERERRESTQDTACSFIDIYDALPDRKSYISSFVQQNMYVTGELFKQLQDYLKVEYRKDTIFAAKNIKESDILLGQKLKKMHGYMLEDLTYLSLALIQKSNFDGIKSEYRNYNFPPQFLDKAITRMNNELKTINEV